MNFLIGLLAPSLGEKWGRIASYAIVAIGVLLLLWAAKCTYDRSVINKHEQKIQQRVAPANQKADTRRAADTVTNAKNEEEMHNVIAAQPDQPISPTSRALSCERLRRAGRSSPACH